MEEGVSWTLFAKEITACFPKRLNLNDFHHKKKNNPYMIVIEELTIAAIAIISQYLNISNPRLSLNLHNVVCQIYFN